MSSPQLIPSEAGKAQIKLQNALENELATELIDQNVSFDFKKFLDEVGPTPSFGEPLGPTPQCLSVDVIRSYHLDELTQTARTVVQQHIALCTTCSGHVTSNKCAGCLKKPRHAIIEIGQDYPWCKRCWREYMKDTRNTA